MIMRQKLRKAPLTECARPRAQQAATSCRCWIDIMPSIIGRRCARPRCALHGSLTAVSANGESQRDSVLQPRVASSELPWEIIVQTLTTPSGLCLYLSCSRATTPLGLPIPSSPLPRVARCSQPWALFRNPFGIPARPPALEMRVRCRLQTGRPGHLCKQRHDRESSAPVPCFALSGGVLLRLLVIVLIACALMVTGGAHG